MNGQPNAPWGKLVRDDTGSVSAWHPLVAHLADVGACTKVLLEVSILGRKLAQIGGLDTFDRTQVARLAALASLHDIGKVNVGFQNKAHPCPEFIAGHVAPLVTLLQSRYATAHRLLNAIGYEELLGWTSQDEGGFLGLFWATIMHHGRAVAPTGSPSLRLWEPTDGLDPVAEARRAAATIRNWLPEAFAEGKPLPVAEAFSHAFNGLVTLADWLGSDVSLFPFKEAGEHDRFQRSLQAARRATAAVGLDVREARNINDRRDPITRITAFPANNLQRAVAALPSPRESSLVVMEAATGSGKTEAALAHFVRLFDAGQVDGIYFALPTRTAATQMHRRVVQATARTFPDEASRPSVVLAVPGYFRVDEVEGRKLAPFDVLWPDEGSDSRRHRFWAAESSKRYLAGAIVVGTVDQVLLTALSARHANMRAVTLLRHLLVVDEIHASDAYMTRILDEALSRHRLAGGHALLMSATLGATARERFLAAGGSPKRPTIEEAEATPYPLLCFSTEHSLTRVPVSAPAGAGKRVSMEPLPAMHSPIAIARRALQAATVGARVLVVRNTVSDCIATQQALETAARSQSLEALLFGVRGIPAPHHSRFARTDREALDVALEASFGKAAPATGCVAIATQTVQQSLDLDADLLVTDLCPIDVLLQRVGRLHRHQRTNRPPGMEAARCVILVPEERDLGSHIHANGQASGPHGIGTVYEDMRVIEATWKLFEVPTYVSIPSDNRKLVERGTHPDVLAQVERVGGDRFARHGGLMDGRLQARRLQASLSLTNWREPFGSGATPTELGAAVLTRLGERDRRVVLPRPQPGPFGAQVFELVMPAHLAWNIEEEVEPSDIRAEAGRIEFTLSTARFVYDRLGLRHLAGPKRNSGPGGNGGPGKSAS